MKMKSQPSGTVPAESGPYDPRQQASQLFEELLLKYEDTHITTAAYGDLIDRFRRSLELSARQFAARLNVSLSTYNRWRAGEEEKPPIHRIKQFKEFIGTETTPETTRNSVFIDENRRITIRPVAQILDRQSRSEQAWFFKHLLPYRAGKVGPTRNQIVDLLTDRNHTVVFHCVFLGPKTQNIYRKPESNSERSKFPAMDSFAELKKAVFKRDKEAAKTRLRGWLVNDAGTAFKIGLSNQLAGTTVLLYNEEETRSVPNLRDRAVDIFEEIPLAVYEAGDHTQLHPSVETRWLEIEPNLSLRQYQTIFKPFIEALTCGLNEDSKRKQQTATPYGIVEFMPTDESITSYQPRLWDFIG